MNYKLCALLVLLAAVSLSFSVNIGYVAPTSANASYIISTSALVNVSLNTTTLSNFTWNWDGTNYTIYNNSLQALYSFNNFSLVNDTSGHGRNLTTTGATWNAYGPSGGSYSTGSGALYYSSAAFAQNISTLSLWFNATSLSGYLAGYGNLYWGLEFSGGKLEYFVFNGGSNSWTGTTTVTTGVWHNVVVVSNSTGSTMYLDGVSQGTSTLTWFSNIGGSTQTFYLGGPSDFAGNISEASIYNQTFSASQAQQQYASQLYQYGATNWTFYANESNLSKVTSNYSACATDGSGNSNCTQTQFVTTDAGLPAISAISSTVASGGTSTLINWTTDTADNSTVNYGLTTALGTINSNVSNSTSHSQTLSSLSTSSVYYYNVTSCDVFGNCSTSGPNSFITSPIISFVSPTPVNATASANTSYQFNISLTTASLSNFTWNWNGTNYTFYNNSLQAMYSFDNFSLLNDTSSHGRNFTNNGATWNAHGPPGGSGGAYSTASGYLSYPSASFAQNISTLSLWFNASSLSGNLVAYGDTYWALEFSSSKLEYYMYNGNINSWTGTTTVTTGVWHNVIVVSNSTGSTMYLDGVAQGTNATTWFSNTGGSTQTFYLGGAIDFPGNISEVSIYNQSFSASQAQQLYASQLYQYGATNWTFYANESNLSKSAYTYYACATDGIGNSNCTQTQAVYANWSAAPVISSISATPLSGETSAIINWTTDTADNSTVNYGLTTALGTNVTNSSIGTVHFISISSLNPATTYYYNVTSCDSLGCSTSGPNSFITDLPTLTFVSPTPSNNSTINTNSALINISSNENLSSCQLTTVGSSSSTVSMAITNASLSTWADYNLTGLNNTSNYFYSVSCTNGVGNTNTSATQNFSTNFSIITINYTSPTETNGAYLNRSNINVNVTAYNINLQNITIYLYNSSGSLINTSISTTSPDSANFTGLSDGIYYFNSTALASSVSNSTATETVTIDTTPPAVSQISPSNGTYTSNSLVNFTFMSNSTYASPTNCSLYINGVYNESNSSVANNTKSNFTLPLTNGLYNWSISCIDQAGNLNLTSNETLTVETTAPTVILNSPTNNYLTNQSSLTFNFTTTDALSATMNCSLFIDGTSNQTNSSVANNTATTFTVSGLSSASHTWSVTCQDLAGNSASSATNTFTTDTIPPGVSISYPTNDLVLGIIDSIPLNFTDSDSISGINTSSCTYSLDGASAVSIPSCANTTFNVSSDGNYNISVSVSDLAGNENTSTLINFTVSTSPPSISIISPANSSYNTSSINLNFTVSDPLSAVSSCWYSFDGGATNTTIPNCLNLTLPTLTDGSHTLTVYSNNSVNNTNSTSVTFLTDATPPSTTLVSPVNSTNTTSLSVNFTCDASDSISGLNNISLLVWDSNNDLVYSNGTALTGTSNESNWSYTFTSRGTYSWNCLTYNLVNNSAYASTNNTFTIQNFASINLTSPINGTILPRGNTSVNYEDILGVVGTNVTLIANVYDNQSLAGLNNVNCNFYFDNSLIGTSLTNSTGYCNLSYDKAPQSFGWHNITVNYSALPSGYTYGINASTNQLDLENWSMQIAISNYRNDAGAYYYVGDIAGAYVNVSRNGSLFDPDNLTVILTDNTGLPVYDTLYLGNFTRISAGEYYGEVVVPTENWLRWKGYANYNLGQGELNTTSSEHTDVEVDSDNALLNLTIIDGASSPINSSVGIYKWGILSRYLIDSSTINSTSPQATESVVLDDTDDVSLNSSNYSIYVSNLSISNSDQNITTQISSVPTGFPAYVPRYSETIATSFHNFSVATLTFPRTVSPDYICHCTEWNFNTGDCDVSWQCDPTSDYQFAENSTNFWFNVTSFSGYAGGEGYDDNLSIWDSTDAEGGSQTIVQGQQADFYANYTNLTSGASINSTGIGCNITFNISGSWSTPAAMTFNSSSLLYQYNMSFLENDTFNWNATCNGSSAGYDTLSANDTVQIGADLIPPNLSIVSPTNSTYNYTSILINITNSSNAANVWWNNGTANITYTSPVNYTFGEGPNTIVAYANDSFGNLNATNVTFFVDSLPPLVSALSPEIGYETNLSSIKLNFTATDNYSSSLNCSLYLNSILNQTNNSVSNDTNTEFALTGLSEGNYNWSISCTNPFNDSASSSTMNFTVSYASLSLVKLNQTVSQPSPGGLVEFNITLTNGPDPLNATVTDTLPTNLTYVSSSDGGSYSEPNATWIFTDLAPDSQAVVYLNASVNLGVVNAFDPVQLITNNASVNAQPPYGSNITSSSSANVDVYYANVSTLELDQTSAQPSPGGTVEFNLTLTNTGNVTLNPTSLVDTLPEGLSYSLASPSPTSVSGQTLTWDNVSSLSEDELVVVYINSTVNSGLVNSGTPILNLTNLINATGVPPDGSNVTSDNSSNVTIYYANVSSGLELSQNAIQPSSGGIVQFNITVNNTGNVTLNATITDQLPVNLTYDSSSPSGSASGQNITWFVSNIISGTSQLLYLNATVNSGVVTSIIPILNLTNTVSVTAQPADGSNLTSSSSANATVYYANVSTLELDQTSAQPSPGGTVEFNLTLTNTGNVTLNPTSIVDILPSGLLFNSSSISPISISGQIITWNNVSSLTPNQSTVLYVNSTVASDLVSPVVPILNLTNNITAIGVPPDGSNVTSSSLANVTVYYANITVLKLDMYPAPVSPGGIVQWEINISNLGQVALSPVLIYDSLPSGFQYNNSDLAYSGINADNNSINWSIMNLPSNSSSIIYLNSSVGAVANGTYYNNVTVIGLPANGNAVTAFDSAAVGIFAPSINVVKSASASYVVTGQELNFTIIITNTGSPNLTVSAQDLLPDNVSFISANVTPTSVIGQNITWENITNLTSGEETSISYTINSSTPGSYQNEIIVLGNPPNGNSVTDNDSAYFDVVSSIPLPPPPSSGGGRSSFSSLSSTFTPSCVDNSVQVTSDGSPVTNANVMVEDASSYVTLYSGTTDSNGNFNFTGCGGDVIIQSTDSGYSSYSASGELVSCGICNPMTNTSATPVVTPFVNTTTSSSPSIGTASSTTNISTQNTSMPNTTAPTLINTTPSANPNPQISLGNTSNLSSETSVLTGPTNGTVGSTVSFFIGSCAQCSVNVESPDGITILITPNSNDKISLPLTEKGNYVISLVNSGHIQNSIVLFASEPPTNAIVQGNQSNSIPVSNDLLLLIFGGFAAILIFGVLAILFFMLSASE